MLTRLPAIMRSLKRWPLTILIIACCTCMAEAGIYKIVDPEGNITYTDTPPAEKSADQLELPPINQLPVSKPAMAAELPLETKVFPGYSVVNLVRPVDDALIYYDQQNIVIQLALTPELQLGHLVQFYLDGAAYGRPVVATSYAVGNLERGSHTVSARVVTAQGEVVANSQSVRVNVQRHFKRN